MSSDHSTDGAHLSMCPGRHPNSFPLNKSEFCPAGFAYLDRWLNHDPGRKHQTGIQRLGSNTEVNATLGVTGPDMLISTCQTGQSYSSCRETIHCNYFVKWLIFHRVYKLLQRKTEGYLCSWMLVCHLAVFPNGVRSLGLAAKCLRVSCVGCWLGSHDAIKHSTLRYQAWG